MCKFGVSTSRPGRNIKKTVCSHEDIHYVHTYEGMTKEQVDAAIAPLLAA